MMMEQQPMIEVDPVAPPSTNGGGLPAVAPPAKEEYNNNNYNDCFPALPDAGLGGGAGALGGQAAQPPSWNNSVRVGSRETTIIVKCRRRSVRAKAGGEETSSFGEKESIRMCKQISKDATCSLR
ncbi:hypothetical protein LSTR_LSTR017046 [Laodelphax striatellus]|uniref:Uncharacterized protein n=1 Tax=Laodelphax striatellus TaxID=195883 RepID=A0A482X0X3_LAOST|nr:hypothetical protein LSTR_LSTR017046 [Laodelphax striatellus]